MMSFLFLLFLIAMILALENREKLSIVLFGAATVLSTVWFLHHASSTLSINL